MDDWVDPYDSGTDSVSDSPSSRSPSPPPEPPKPLPKLTLILPSLKDLQKKASSSSSSASKKASSKSKSKSKSKAKQPQVFGFGEYDGLGSSAQLPKAPPRPVKLKPLKEVLSGLIVRLKKKDDYAFFLKPVNLAEVPGYTDVVKRPMDFGTMSIKVQRGRYRSLEEFTEDFRLVTGNAKLFNPQGSIYYTEAERLETWGLDQITKAAATVIQYETDWNIEIEKDDRDGEEDTLDDYSAMAAAADDEGQTKERSRSPSVSLLGGHLGMLRRAARAQYAKSAKENPDPNAPPKESIDAEGRLPGSKDGVGAFPPGSELTRTMLLLKLKGKRYKTKKERLRIETHGPPSLPDGSLDYYQVEDPFTYLSALVPDPPARPQLIPIYTPPPIQQPIPSAMPSLAGTPSRDRDTPGTGAGTPAPPVLSSYPLPTMLPPPPLDRSSHPLPPTTKHWTLQRNAGRRRGGDDAVPGAGEDDRAWEEPREAHTLDFGAFAELAGIFAGALRDAGISLPETREEADVVVKDAVRESVEVPPADESGAQPGPRAVSLESRDKDGYWSTKNALEAEGYVRDVVYGGVDGLAYIRSLAEFVAAPSGVRDLDSESADVYDRDGDVKMEVEEMQRDEEARLPLGCTLASWVTHHVVDPLTEGRHDLLRRTARELMAPTTSSPSDTSTSVADVKQEPSEVPGRELGTAADPDASDDKLPAQVAFALHVRPRAAVTLASIKQIYEQRLDVAALLHAPEDAVQSDTAWATVTGVADAQATPSVEQTDRALRHAAEIIERLQGHAPAVKSEADVELDTGALTGTAETADLRELRLNLLALVRRAPVDTLATLPQDLLTEALRPLVSTLSFPLVVQS